MSIELVKKALNLFEQDFSKTIKSTEFDENYEVSPKKPQLKKEKVRKQTMGLYHFKKPKSSIDEYLKKNNRPSLEENLSVLQQLSQLKPKPEAAQKILKQHERELMKYKLTFQEPEPEEPKSILFPEENEPKKRRKKRKRND